MPPQPARTVPEPRLRQRPDAQDVAEQWGEPVQALVAGTPIRYLAHYRFGKIDLSADDLPPRPGPGEPELTLPALERAGQRLISRLSQADEELSYLNTGPLIRLLVQTAEGALICDSIIPEHCLVAAVTGVPAPGQPVCRQQAVRASDHELSRRIDELRAQHHHQPRDYGGYNGVSLTDEAPTVPFAPGEPRQPAMRRCLETITGLHYLALFHRSELVEDLDRFEEPAVQAALAASSPRSSRRSAEDCRWQYRQVGLRMPEMLSRLTVVLDPVLGERLIRLVADVERGAIYVYPLPGHHFVLAVTLMQELVSVVEDGVAQLARHLESLMGPGASADDDH
jgi:hypothetical protein